MNLNQLNVTVTENNLLYLKNLKVFKVLKDYLRISSVVVLFFIPWFGFIRTSKRLITYVSLSLIGMIISNKFL